jgi:cell division protein FtsI (penicillin-binding protein 3)
VTAVPSYGRRADPRLHLGRRRLEVLALVFIAAFAGIALRLGMLMPGSAPIATAEAGMEAEARTGRRPDIVDREGRLLATDLRMPSVYADPLLVPDPVQAARALAAALPGVDADTLAARFDAAKRFAWVKHQITPAEQAAVLELGIPGVGFKFAEHRVYPNGRSAAHVLGFVNIDNHGLAGVEYAFDRGRVQPAPPEGAPARLALSLDTRVQEVMADELGRAYRQFGAKGACGIVLDQLTGEVVAFVSLPDFDLNEAGVAGEEERKNRCTGGTYELGSIFKIVAHAMALDSGKVSLRDRFDASSPLAIGRFRIRDDHAKNRVLSVPEIFIYSSNIGTARMTFAAGGARPLEAFLRQAGFYAAPPLEIPEVAEPQLPRRWPDVTTATVSFGHGIAVTPLQFVTAVSALAGDGTYLPPTILKRDPDALPQRSRLVSAQTAEAIRALMWLTVAKGTGTKGRVEGYLVGGKTGTAEKAIQGGRGYKRDAVLASFAAVFPIDQPRYTVLAMLDEPKGDSTTFGHRYGGWTAAPIVAQTIARIGPLLGVPRSPEGAEQKLRALVEPKRVVTAGMGAAGVGEAGSAAQRAHR